MPVPVCVGRAAVDTEDGRRSPVESGPDHLPGTLSGGRALSWERGSISASADPAGTRPRGWAGAPALAASA